jgi:hypothetical protein
VAYRPVANTCYAFSMEQKLSHSLQEMRNIMWCIDPLLIHVMRLAWSRN